ncbi:MAG: hypothetical protein RLP02_19545 [Coleofasciculus sp. C2-GNP5-27]
MFVAKNTKISRATLRISQSLKTPNDILMPHPTANGDQWLGQPLPNSASHS